MAKHTVSLTGSSGSEVIGKTNNTPNGADGYGGTVFIKNNSGTGTITLQMSPDGGTTKYTVKDVTGTDITGTSNGAFSFVTGIGNKVSEYITFYATLSGGSSADFDVILFDKNG